MVDTFNFAPERNVPETLPRQGNDPIITMGGWQFASRPVTPYQKRFKVTLYGMRWYLNVDETYNATTNINFNARALELFYERNELWNPFIFKHQHFGDLTCRFASPVTVPAAMKNSAGLIDKVEVNLIHHNPGFT